MLRNASIRIINGLCLSLLSTSAWAFEWPVDPQEFSARASVLARGSSQVGFNTAYRKVNHKFTAMGGSAGLGQDISEKKQTTDGVARRSYELEMTETRFIPSWSYGMSSRWSIAARIPITQTETRAQSRSELTTSNGAKFILSSVQEQSTFEADTKIENNNSVQVGNAEFLSKEKIFSGYKNTFSILQKFRFPSAEVASSDVYLNPFPEPSGYALGLSAVYEYRAAHRFSLVFVAGHDMNFSDEIRLRSFSDNEKKVTRDPGDETVGSVSSDFLSSQETKFSLGYIQKYKAKDKFEGAKGLSGEDTSAEQRLAQLGFEYAPQYWVSQYEMSLAAQLSYCSTLGGKNTADADMVSLQFQVVY